MCFILKIEFLPYTRNPNISNFNQRFIFFSFFFASFLPLFDDLVSVECVQLYLSKFCGWKQWIFIFQKILLLFSVFVFSRSNSIWDLVLISTYNWYFIIKPVRISVEKWLLWRCLNLCVNTLFLQKHQRFLITKWKLKSLCIFVYRLNEEFLICFEWVFIQNGQKWFYFGKIIISIFLHEAEWKLFVVKSVFIRTFCTLCRTQTLS